MEYKMKPNKLDYVITYDEVYNIIDNRIEALDSIDMGCWAAHSMDEGLLLELEAGKNELYRLLTVLRRLQDAKDREYQRQLRLGGYDE